MNSEIIWVFLQGACSKQFQTFLNEGVSKMVLLVSGSYDVLFYSTWD